VRVGADVCFVSKTTLARQKSSTVSDLCTCSKHRVRLTRLKVSASAEVERRLVLDVGDIAALISVQQLFTADEKNSI